MLTTVSFPSLRLERLPIQSTMNSSVSLTGWHVAWEPGLDSGTFLMGHVSQRWERGPLWLQHSTETEEMMEQST
jgi:hypothetical protein